MCLVNTPKISAASKIFAAPDNAESIRQGDMQARLQRRRQGAAANILTSARGLPATPKLGSAT